MLKLNLTIDLIGNRKYMAKVSYLAILFINILVTDIV